MRVLVVPSALVAVTAAMLMGCSMLPRISSDDGTNRSSAIQAIAPEFAEKSGGSSLYVALYNVVFRINLTRPHRVAEHSGTGYSFSVDRKHNLYTVDETNVVRVYDSKLTTLKRTFSFEGSESGKAVVIDGDAAFVGTSNSQTNASQIDVFRASSSGVVRPRRTIAGARTGLSSLTGLAVDSDGTTYAGTFGPTVLVFAPGAHGNVAPIRTMSGFGYVYDLAIGADGNLYVMQLTGSSWQIVVVPKTQNGPVQPVRTLLTGRYGMFVALGPTGTMYVPPTETRETRVAVFAPGASGNAKPIGFVGKGDAAAGHVALENPWFLP
jgi:hypothetical protein